MSAQLDFNAASELARTWGGPVAVGMGIGAVANVLYALLMLRISETKCDTVASASTAASRPPAAHLIHAEGLAELEFEGGAKLKNLVHGDPTVLALHINNHQLQQLISQADSLAQSERRRMKKLLDLAERELAVSSMTAGSVHVVKHDAAGALLDAARADTAAARLELARKVPRTTEDLAALVGGSPPEGWGPKEAPWKCVQMLCETRTLQLQYSEKRQEAERLRRLQQLAESRKQLSERVRKDYTPNLDGKTVRDLVLAEAQGVGGETNDDALKSFYSRRVLSPYLALPELGRERLDKEAGEQSEAAARAEQAKREALERLEAQENALNSSCGLWLRRANWTYVHNAELRQHKDVTDEAKDKWCVDYVSGDPTHRTRVGLALPQPYWERSPAAPPKLVSFLVLAESGREAARKEEVEAVVRWVLKCALGGDGGSGQPKLRAEFLFMVAGGPEKANEVDALVVAELEALQLPDRNVEQALFDFRSATAIRPHGSSTSQAFDLLSHMASGSTLVLLRSAEVPDAECARLDAALATLDAHPRLALMGFHPGELKAGDATLGSAEPGKQVPAPEAPALGVPFTFVGHVSGLPLIVRSEALKFIGGIDPVAIPGPFGPTISTFMLCTRFWLAGYQVAAVGEEFAPFKFIEDLTGDAAGVAYPESAENSVPPEKKIISLLEHYEKVNKAIKTAE